MNTTKEPLFKLVVIAVCVTLAVCGCRPQPTVFPPAVKDSQPAKDSQQANDPLASLSVMELISRIDENVDPDHPEYSPAVFELGKRGKSAIPPLLDLMTSNYIPTRQCALNAIHEVMKKEFGFDHGWRTPSDQARYGSFLKSLGSLDAEGSREDREKSLLLWRQWIRSPQSE